MVQDDPKPLPPEPHECCGGGSCCPCVWDRYHEALRQWQQRHGLDAEQAPAAERGGTDPYR